MKLKTRVSKMGEKLVIVIPQIMHEDFPHKTKVIVSKHKTNKGE